MIQFILNENLIRTSLSPGTLLLDFIRYHQNLRGTKIGCREGDCGACTVLVGRLENENIKYQAVTSCLMALGNAGGAHIVTIEGINIQGLNAVQQAFAEEGATQCGFCTPGFIVSLTGACMNPGEVNYDSAIDAMNGNICRCTGYKSIERAANKIANELKTRTKDPISHAIENGYIPSYFSGIKTRLLNLKNEDQPQTANPSLKKILGGGTDLYVQQHETMVKENIRFIAVNNDYKGIHLSGNTCIIGGSASVTDLAQSAIMQTSFLNLGKFMKLISSTQIRNMATVAGNFVNASPIGDLTIFFLALDSSIVLDNGSSSRTLKLRKFYKDYKLLDKANNEVVTQVNFELPTESSFFNFEKVSKRTWLDIASVNTAISLNMNEDIISRAHLSAGGVGPIPFYLSKSSDFLTGKRITGELVNELIAVVQSEISPISDARGSEEYKRLLLSQLIKTHFIQLFPGLPTIKFLHSS